jgi:serine/threonine-protein kinase HipA
METAFVKIWNQRVGAVAWDASAGVGNFEFEPSFLNSGLDLAPRRCRQISRGAVFSASRS